MHETHGQDKAPEHAAYEVANAALETLREQVQHLRERVEQLHRCTDGVQALVEAIPRTDRNRGEDRLRRDGMVHLAYRVLRQAGHPLHVREILSRMGPPGEHPNAGSNLTSSLARYAKSGRHFVRTGQGVYDILVEPATHEDAT